LSEIIHPTKVNVKGEQTQVQVWDTAGQQQFHKITTSYYKGAQGIMLVFDITDQSSLDNMEYWIKNIKSHASDSVHVALIGNKCDLLPENMMGGTGKDDERTSSIDSPDTRTK
jgi:small GTP-binding protein